MLNVLIYLIMLLVISLNVLIVSVIKLSAVRLSVIMMRVVAHQLKQKIEIEKHSSLRFNSFCDKGQSIL